MDGENNGKPYEQMDDLGGETPLFLETPIISSHQIGSNNPSETWDFVGFLAPPSQQKGQVDLPGWHGVSI